MIQFDDNQIWCWPVPRWDSGWGGKPDSVFFSGWEYLYNEQPWILWISEPKHSHDLMLDQIVAWTWFIGGP